MALTDFGRSVNPISTTGMSSLALGVPGVTWHSQILADQLTLFQPGRAEYAHLITTGTPGFSDLATPLGQEVQIMPTTLLCTRKVCKSLGASCFCRGLFKSI